MLIVRNEFEVKIAFYDKSFNRRNVNNVANQFDAKVEKFQPEIRMATIRDNLGRLLWIEYDKNGTCYCSACSK